MRILCGIFYGGYVEWDRGAGCWWMRERAQIFGWARCAVGAVSLGDHRGEYGGEFRHWALLARGVTVRLSCGSFMRFEEKRV